MPIPFDRNSKFVGRQNILADIRAAFKDPQKRRLAILRGSIGNGKTQIALEYAYLWQEETPGGHILWMEADDILSSSQAWENLKELLPKSREARLGTRYPGETDDGPWLCILDEANEHLISDCFETSGPRGVNPLLCDSFSGREWRTIFIARKSILSTAAEAGAIIEIPSFTAQEAEDFLLLQNFGSDELMRANLISALSSSPLALSMAANYLEFARPYQQEKYKEKDPQSGRQVQRTRLERKEMTVAAYIKQLPSKEDQLQRQIRRNLGSSTTTADASLTAILNALRMSLNYLAQNAELEKLTVSDFFQSSQSTVNILAFMAVLNRECIHEQTFVWSNRDVKSKLDTLRNFGLITPLRVSNSYTMSFVVQSAMREWSNLNEKISNLAIVALMALHSAAKRNKDAEADNDSSPVKSVDASQLQRHFHEILCYSFQTPKLFGELRSNLMKEVDYLSSTKPQFLERMFSTAEFKAQLGNFSHAEILHELVLQYRNETFGKDSFEVVSSLQAIGILSWRMGKHERGETYLRQALSLKLYDKSYNGETAAMAASQLAGLLLFRGKDVEVEQLHRAALEMRGLENNLEEENRPHGESFRAIFQEAELLQRKSIDMIRNQTRDRESFRGIEGQMADLALILDCNGGHEEAESLKTLVISAADLYRPDYRWYSFSRAERYLSLETIYKQSLSLKEIVFGKGHDEALASTKSLELLQFFLQRISG